MIRLFILAVSFSCFTSHELPSDIERCKAADVECIARVATKLIHENGKGRPDVGFPAYEPFTVHNLVLQEGNDSPVNLHLSLKDVVIHGISGINVERMVGFEKDAKKSKFEVYAVAPQLTIFGLYKSNGRILVLPVRGEGKFNMTLDNVKISVKFKPTIVEKDDGHYLNVEKMKIRLDPAGAKIHMERFVADSNPLGDSINEFLNENWRDFWDEIYPPISEAMLNIVRDIINKPLAMFAYDFIYLPS